MATLSVAWYAEANQMPVSGRQRRHGGLHAMHKSEARKHSIVMIA
ncbi:hypothetical protein [Furfurilactobacillus siliginis]|nr:hypothetical protein [Furfurilactobacillus siliginis]